MTARARTGIAWIGTVVVIVLALLSAGVFQVQTNTRHDERIQNLKKETLEIQAHLLRIETKLDVILQEIRR